jgi:hypothetical protein
LRSLDLGDVFVSLKHGSTTEIERTRRVGVSVGDMEQAGGLAAGEQSVDWRIPNEAI